MPFLHDLRIILVAFAEMPCFVRDSLITCIQFVSVYPPWDVIDWARPSKPACLEYAVSLLSLVQSGRVDLKDYVIFIDV